MRAARLTLTMGLCVAAAFGCTRTNAPTGRWQGTYESQDVMIAARLEIDPGGNIFLSAPDAMDIAGASSDDRLAIRQRLADDLTLAWGEAQPKQFAFDGHVFRKPGGVAPQLEWDPDRKSMTAVIYLGLRSGIRVPLHPVSDFSNDPWRG